jgi:hypothetical protein
MIEARMRYKGKRYSLGSFKTDKEVDAARAAALRVLDRVEADKPAPTKPPVPSLALIGQLADMGIYDRDSDGIMVLLRRLKRRYDMVTEGVQNATPPAQTLTLDEMVVLSGGSSVLPQNRW